MIGKAGRDFAVSSQDEKRLAKADGEAATVGIRPCAFDPPLAQAYFGRRGDTGVADLVHLNPSVKSTRRQSSSPAAEVTFPSPWPASPAMALPTDEEDYPGCWARRLRATAWHMKLRRLSEGSADSPRVEYFLPRGDHGRLMQLATQIAGVLGFLGVALGAFGAHQLASLLAANQTATIWQTAVLYHLVHSVAALWAASRNPTVVWIWAAGILVFSGSLYILALTNIRWLGAITPIGGLLFLAGWLVVAIKPQ